MREMKRTGLLALLVAAVAFPLVAWATFAADGVERPLRGTIEVDRGAALAAQAKVTLDEAKAAALEAVPGATFVEGELDEEDGFLVYDVELTVDGQEVEVSVDAGNAAVLEVERDDEDDDDDDDDEQDDEDDDGDEDRD